MSKSTKTSPSEFTSLTAKITFLVRSKLWAQILLCMLLGFIIGLLISKDGLALVSQENATLIAGWLVLPGHLFLGLIKMIMIPLVASSIILSIADTKDLKKLRRIGLRIVPYFVGTTTVAVIIGIVIAMTINPGKHIGTGVLSNIAVKRTVENPSPDNASQERPIHERIVEMIPTNPLNAALNESMLQIVMLAIFVGIALVSIGPKHAKPLVGLNRSVREISMVIVGWAMLLAPLAVLGFIAQITMQIGLSALVGMSVYMGAVLLGLLLLLCFYLAVIFLVSRAGPLDFLRKVREVQLLAFSTSSSAAVMPLSIQVAQEELKIEPSTANFVIPLGATVNMDGTALYQIVAAIFLTQIFGIDLSFGEMALLIATTIGASIGAPSTPGVGIVVLSAILTNIGVPVSGIALILGVDRILDMSRTAINVTGDLAACVVMDRWLG